MTDDVLIMYISAPVIALMIFAVVKIIGLFKW